MMQQLLFAVLYIPEPFQRRFQRGGTGQILDVLPVRREQTGGVGLRKAVVQKQHHAFVLWVRTTRPAACSTLFMPG